MQHDPSVSLLAQGSGKIVAMSGGARGATADPYGNAVAAALSAALSSPSSTPIPVVVNKSVTNAAATAFGAPTAAPAAAPTPKPPTHEEIHLKETGISLKGSEKSHFLIDKLTSVINPASKPVYNAATEYNTGALATPDGKEKMIKRIGEVCRKITTAATKPDFPIKISIG